MRFLTALTLGGAGTATATVSINPSEQSLYVVPIIHFGQVTTLAAVGHSSGFNAAVAQWAYSGGPQYPAPSMIAVSTAQDTSWDLTFTCAGIAGACGVYVFASTDHPPASNMWQPGWVALSDGVNQLAGQKAMGGSIPVVIASDQSAVPVSITAKRQATYGAPIKPGATGYLSHVFAGAGSFQYATIYHGVGATKTLRLKSAIVRIGSASAAVSIAADLIALTSAVTPATGNPVITPAPVNRANVAEATVLALPTTQGTEAASPISSYGASIGITGAASVISPPPAFTDIVLWPLVTVDGTELDDPTMRAGTAEGLAVTIRASAAATLAIGVGFIFTEE